MKLRPLHWILIPLLLLLSLAGTRTPAGNTVQVGYGVLGIESGQGLAASALFRLERDQILVSEAAVAAVEPISAGQIFVDRAGPQTGLALVNPNAETVSLDLLLLDPGGVAAGQTRIQLDPGEHTARFIRQAGGFFPGLSADFEGTMAFSVVNAALSVAAVTIRQSSNVRGEPLFATLPVIPLGASAQSPAQMGSPPMVFPHIGAGGPLSTQILLLNPHVAEIRGEVRITASDGSPLQLVSDGSEASVFPYQLQPGGSLRLSLTSPSGVRQGYAAISEEQGRLPAGTAVFRFLNEGGSPISEAGVARGPVTRRARIFVDAANTRTGVALSNLDNATQSVRFSLLDRFGQALDSTERELSEAGHLAIFADELFPDISATFTGQLRIEADQPIVPVTLKLSSNALGDLILTTLPVVDEEATTLSSPLILPQIGFGLGFGTRLIALNPFEEAVRVRLELRDSAGSPLVTRLGSIEASEAELILEPGHSAQLRPGEPVEVVQVLPDALRPLSSELPLEAGSSRRLTPVTVDSRGRVRDDLQFSFASLDEAVATVDEAGNVQGLEPGFSTLTLESDGVLANVTLTVIDLASSGADFAVKGLSGDLAGRLYLVAPQRHAVFRSENVVANPLVWAGTLGTSGLRDAARLEALFNQPAFSVLNQADGTLLVSDSANHVIRQVRPGSGGAVSTLAGSGTEGNRDGSLTEAQFSRPQGVVCDPAGNLWVADQGSHVIRRIDLVAGRVETIAGMAFQPGNRDGPGTNARFNSPAGLALEVEPVAVQLRREIRGEPRPPVSVLVADSGNSLIRRVFEDGRVETVSAVAPRNRPALATDSGVFQPVGIATDAFGRIYVSEPGRNRVQLILPDGTTAQVTSNGVLDTPQGIATTSDGTLAVAVADRAVRQISFGAPSFDEIENQTDPDGQNRVILRGRNFSPDTMVVLSTGTVTEAEVVDTQTLTFRAEPPPDIDEFGTPTFLNVFNRGGLQQSFTRIGPDGEVGGVSFNNGSWDTTDLALDAQGNLLVLTSFTLYEISRSSRLLFPLTGGEDIENGPARQASVFDSMGVATGFGSLLIAQSGSHRIRLIDASGAISTIAGTGAQGFSGDGGPAPNARFDSPAKAIFGPGGKVFIADTGNHRIRVVDLQSEDIGTLAGTGSPGFAEDGGPAGAAQLNLPTDLALTADALYVADSANHRVRRIDLNTGLISTVAGDGSDVFSGEDGPAVAAGIPSPSGIAAGPDGSLYIVTANRVVRVDPDTGILDTVAGTGEPGFFGPDPGQLATEFDFDGAGKVQVDAAGNLYISETRLFGRVFLVDSISGVIQRLPFNPLNRG